MEKDPSASKYAISPEFLSEERALIETELEALEAQRPDRFAPIEKQNEFAHKLAVLLGRHDQLERMAHISQDQ